MKRFFISLVILFIFLISQCQFQITGIVLDEGMNPLVGASVVIKDSGEGSITSNEGVFSLNSKSDSIILKASFIGYETKEQSWNSKLKFVQFKMVPILVFGEDVLIKGIRAGSKTPMAFTNIPQSEIRKNSVIQDIPMLLENTPSVVSSSEAGTGVGYTAMRIRGTDASRINVTVNGVPLNDAESHGVFWVDLPDVAASVNDIQLQRGAGTSTNGAGAFGASLNLQTQTTNQEPYGSASVTLGSFNTRKLSMSAGTGVLSNKMAFDFRYSKLNSDGYIKRSFSDHSSVFLSGGYFGSKTIVRGTVMLGQEQTGIAWWGVPDYMMDIDRTFNPAGQHYDLDSNVVFYKGQTDNYIQNHYQLMMSHQFTDELQATLTLHATSGRGYYEQYIPESDDWGSLNELSSYGISPWDTNILATDMIRQKWLDNWFYGAVYNINYSLENLDISLGGGYNMYDGDHFGLIKWTQYNTTIPNDYEWYRNTGTKTDLNTYLKGDFQILKGLNIYADMQYRSIFYKMTGPDDDLMALDQKHNYQFFNPKFGLYYDFNKKFSGYASLAIAHREPGRADLKDAVKDFAPIYPVAEKLQDYELGVKYSGTLFNFGLNQYFMEYRDQLILTGKLNNAGYALMENVPESYRRGMELWGSVNLLSIFTWQGNLTISRNKIIDYTSYVDDYDNGGLAESHFSKTNISYSPEKVGSSSFTMRIAKKGTLNWTTKRVGKQYIDNTSNESRMLKAYNFSNFRLDYQIPVKNAKNISAQFLVLNITNKKYVNNGYGGYYIYDGEEVNWIYYFPQAPRHYMVKFSFEF